MPYVSEFNYARIKQLQGEFSRILEHLSQELEKLENSSNRFKNQINDRTSTEALKIISTYKMIIKKMNETVTDSLRAVKDASEGFAYIEEEMANDL